MFNCECSPSGFMLNNINIAKTPELFYSQRKQREYVILISLGYMTEEAYRFRFMSTYIELIEN